MCPIDESIASLQLKAHREIRDAVTSSGLFNLLREKLRKINIDKQIYYIAEGDTLLDEDQLSVYAYNRQKVDEAQNAAMTADFAGLGVSPLGFQTRGLTVITQSGKIVRWKPGTILSYRVVKNTFQNQSYELVVECISKAARDWEQTCGIQFQHSHDLDKADGVGHAGALFSVRQLDTGGQFIAAAFFPNDPKDRRRVLIDPSFYDANLGYDKVGVLRHELGHVLGFRHEHIRRQAPPVCPGEPLWDVEYLSKYDPQSVMHYFCGGVGSKDLRISDLDRASAQQVYGPPLATIHLIAAED